MKPLSPAEMERLLPAETEYERRETGRSNRRDG
jgi:hypothetical protein